MTTTELIDLLIKNEKGGITHKPREISLTINDKYMPNPQITLLSTGDGIFGAEIDLDINGDFMEEQEPKIGYISIDAAMAVFDDFMRSEVDEEDTKTFLEMLKDKAESERK